MFDRYTLLMLVFGICVVNGILSPYLNLAIPIAAGLMPEAFPRTVEWVLFFASVFLATATLLFSGVPCALYERLVDDSPDSTVSMWIWLGTALVLSLPAVANLL